MSVNISNLSTYSDAFSCFLQSCSTGIRGAKGADWDIILMWSSSPNNKDIKNINKGACIEVAGIRRTYTRNTCTNRNISAGNTFFAKDNCVKGAFVKGACTKSICAGSASALGQLRMHLQFL